MKAFRGFDIEGQQDPSLIPRNCFNGEEPKEDCTSHTGNGDNFQAYIDTTVKGTESNDTKGSEAGVSSSAEDGQTALHVAVRHRHLEMVRFLLERGADVNKPDEKGWTPKALADIQANRGIYDLILNYENKKKSDGKNHACVSSSSFTNPTHAEAVSPEKKRVTIHMKFEKNKHSQKQLPKLIVLPDSLEDLLRIAGMHFFYD